MNSQSSYSTPAALNANTMRQRIDALSHQLVEIYRSAATERERLHQQEWDAGEGAYSVLAEASHFGDAIQGFARLIGHRLNGAKPEKTLREIARLGPFEHIELMNWRLHHEHDYPLICQYLEGLDHLRLLIIFYFIQRANPRRAGRRVVERGLVPQRASRGKPMPT